MGFQEEAPLNAARIGRGGGGGREVPLILRHVMAVHVAVLFIRDPRVLLKLGLGNGLKALRTCFLFSCFSYSRTVLRPAATREKN